MKQNIALLKQELETTNKEFWNIDPRAGQLLQALLFTHQRKNILEIGTSNGYSAILMAEIASQYGGHITSIEFSEKRIALAHENIAKAGLSDYVTILQGDALGVLKGLETQPSSPRMRGSTWMPDQVGHDTIADELLFDFFFIDASKKQYGDFFKECMRLASPNAIIVADNTISHRHSLDDFFDVIQNEPRAQILEVSIGTGLVITILN